MDTICIPLHPKGGKFGTDLELRFALRSLERHFQGGFRVVIVGSKLPDWLQGAEHLPGAGLKSSLAAAAAAFPEGFFWFYDDCCLLQDMTAEAMRVTPARKEWEKPATAWSRKLERIHERLLAEGRAAWDYSRPHGPYWFDKAMVDEGFADWPGMAGKFPWESWILSKRDWPRRHGVVKQYYGPFRDAPAKGMWFVNYNDRGNTVELRAWLRKRFPAMCRFEKTGEASRRSRYEGWMRPLWEAWEAEGRPQLRTICECAVGPHSLLEPFEGLAERTILIEPDPGMAARARQRYPWAEVREVAIAGSRGKANLRKLDGASYVKGIPWAPAFKACPQRARRAGKVPVRTVPFGDVDDGRIDLLNLDCEGSEWWVLHGMRSRPRLLQIELYPEHGHYREITAWLEREGYAEIRTWGNANRVMRRA